MATDGSIMTDQGRNERGRFAPKVPDERFFEALRELDGAGGTQEIADEVGCIYDTAYKRLRRLEDEGGVTRRKVANANLWVRVDE
jgi:hypothetical protein